MYLVQLLLPVHDNDGHTFAPELFDEVRTELTARYGGLTAYVRSPAEGAWRDQQGDISRDDVVIVEVMCQTLDRAYWGDVRERLKQRFRQQELIVRAMPFEML